MSAGWILVFVVAWSVSVAMRRWVNARPRDGTLDRGVVRRPADPALTMAQVLRQLDKIRTEAGRRPSPRRMPAAPMAAESRVVVGQRSERVMVDRDEEAAAVAQARIDQAEARNIPLDRASHQAFDEQIRQAAAEGPSPARLTVRQLRDAFVWSEILGPPGGRL